jgi:two-component system, NtrC family, response regulator AtoC
MESTEDEGREIRVLVADDDEGVRLYLSVILSEEGCRVLSAPDGFEGWEILKTNPVDLLITDYKMPRMNGLDLISWSRLHLPEVPAVLMTGQEDPVLEAAARACGALRVFLKPLPLEELLLLIGRLRRATRSLELAAGSPSLSV